MNSLEKVIEEKTAEYLATHGGLNPAKAAELAFKAGVKAGLSIATQELLKSVNFVPRDALVKPAAPPADPL